MPAPRRPVEVIRPGDLNERDADRWLTPVTDEECASAPPVA
ncbi:hypothetical protein [Lentzea sp. NPDC055074]